MFCKAITYKTNKKCLADNRTAKYEASVGSAENLPPSVRQISKTLNIYSRKFNNQLETLQESWLNCKQTWLFIILCSNFLLTTDLAISIISFTVRPLNPPLTWRMSAITSMICVLKSKENICIFCCIGPCFFYFLPL